MLRSVFIFASILAVLITVGFLALRFTSQDAQPVDAAELLAQAQTAGISPAPGSVLKVTIENYHRGRGVILSIDTREEVAQIPNNTTTEVWFLIGDEAGKATRRYLVERDSAGNVTQEELFDGEREYMYSVPYGAVYALPPRSSPMNADIQVDMASILQDNAAATYIGERDSNGRRVHVLEIRRVLDAPTSDPLPEQGYVGMYLGDLAAVEIVTEIELDTETLVPVLRVTRAVDAQGHETIILSKSYTEISTLSADQLPADFFQLHHAPSDVTVVDSQ